MMLADVQMNYGISSVHAQGFWYGKSDVTVITCATG